MHVHPVLREEAMKKILSINADERLNLVLSTHSKFSYISFLVLVYIVIIF